MNDQAAGRGADSMVGTRSRVAVEGFAGSRQPEAGTAPAIRGSLSRAGSAAEVARLASRLLAMLTPLVR